MLQTFPVDDRRAADRRADPVCRTCDSSEVKPVVRTTMAVYFRCYSCNVVWVSRSRTPPISLAPGSKANTTGYVRNRAEHTRGLKFTCRVAVSCQLSAFNDSV